MIPTEDTNLKQIADNKALYPPRGILDLQASKEFEHQTGPLSQVLQKTVAQYLMGIHKLLESDTYMYKTDTKTKKQVNGLMQTFSALPSWKNRNPL